MEVKANGNKPHLKAVIKAVGIQLRIQRGAFNRTAISQIAFIEALKRISNGHDALMVANQATYWILKQHNPDLVVKKPVKRDRAQRVVDDSNLVYIIRESIKLKITDDNIDIEYIKNKAAEINLQCSRSKIYRLYKENITSSATFRAWFDKIECENSRNIVTGAYEILRVGAFGAVGADDIADYLRMPDGNRLERDKCYDLLDVSLAEINGAGYGLGLACIRAGQHVIFSRGSRETEYLTDRLDRAIKRRHIRGFPRKIDITESIPWPQRLLGAAFRTAYGRASLYDVEILACVAARSRDSDRLRCTVRRAFHSTGDWLFYLVKTMRYVQSESERLEIAGLVSFINDIMHFPERRGGNPDRDLCEHIIEYIEIRCPFVENRNGITIKTLKSNLGEFIEILSTNRKLVL